MLVYLDASVWVKRYVIEEGSERVRQWFREGPVVATSPLALIEVMSTLVRKERAGELAAEDMESALDAAEADFERFASVPLLSGVTNNDIRSLREGPAMEDHSEERATGLMLWRRRGGSGTSGTNG